MSDNIEIFIPNQNARKSLSKKLNLEFDEAMQDWEWEIADSTRINEFIDEYEKLKTSDDEKKSLMEIIIDSSNDLMYDKNLTEFKKHLNWVLKTLSANTKLHAGSINYWTRNNSFNISSELKKIKIKQNREI